ncbi:MAG: type III pantothenate kinase [Cyanobacteria bacterium P01_A01_bin.15]
MADWLALVIGNTRWHWAWFYGGDLKQVWHTPHLSSQNPTDIALRAVWAEQAPPQCLHLPIECLDIWAVSVVPTQAHYLAHLPRVYWIDRALLKGGYPTLGLDRVTTLMGAGQQYGWPVLVIDGGTALTFTAGAEGTFMGGAILLGVRSHLAALHDYTAALPSVDPPVGLPHPWASDTPNAIQGGVLLSTLASIDHFIESWRQRYPQTAIVFTGGDGAYLYQLYRQQQSTKQNQALQNRTWSNPNLMFLGICAYRSEATRLL